MVEKLKQIDKKFFIIIGAIFGVLILVIIIAVVAKLLSGPGNNYTKLENKLVVATQNYLKENPESIPEKDTSITIDTATLITSGDLKELSKYVEDTCTGTVLVMNNGGNSLYIPDLVCSNYSTTHLSTKIIDDHLVVNPENEYEAGLYAVEDEFIFKGKNVNNYVSFGGLTWRIVKIDSNGNIRLIKAAAEKSKNLWDNRYNVEMNKTYGINDYENSIISEVLYKSYLKVNDKNKSHLIPHDVCIGKRALTNKEISYDVDCSSTLGGQYISLINTLDFPMASLDEKCTRVGDGACINYNYLYSTITTSWTTIGVEDNAYEVYNFSGGYFNKLTAKNSLNYNWIVYITGQEIYVSGDGTIDKPYTIE